MRFLDLIVILLDWVSTKEGESSKSGEERSNIGENSKPTCHNCGEIDHTTNI